MPAVWGKSNKSSPLGRPGPLNPIVNSAKKAGDPKKKKKKRVVSSSEKERIRRWIVRLVMIAYWLLISEGAMRKWGAKGSQELIYFIRDPFVLASYYLAYKYSLWPRMNSLFKFGMQLSVAYMGLMMVQLAMTGLNPLICAFGWRNYFFYLPLVFLIGKTFLGPDLARLCRHTLYMSLPIAVLCYKQFRSAPDDVVNSSLGEGSQAMLVANGIVRTSGTFTVAAAQSLYVGSLVAMVLSIWLLPAKFRTMKPFALLVVSASTFVTFAVAGSRTLWAFTAIVILGAMCSVYLIYKDKMRVLIKKVIVVPFLIVIAGLAYMTVFKEASDSMVKRQSEASANEGNSLLRITGNFTAVFYFLPSAQFLGSCVGLYSNGGARLAYGKVGIMPIEDEWSRLIAEGGMLGFFYIYYRCWFTFFLLRGALQATSVSKNPLPLLLSTFEAFNMLVGQITGQGTIHGYCWLFAGFCMAANRLGHRKTSQLGDPWS